MGDLTWDNLIGTLWLFQDDTGALRVKFDEVSGRIPVERCRLAEGLRFYANHLDAEAAELEG